MSHQILGTGTTGVRRATGAALALVGVLTLLVLAFLWPAMTAEPRDVPLAITGPDQAVAAVGAALAERQPGVVDLTPVADREAAVALIESQEASGAIVLGDVPEVLTASAAGTQVSQVVAAVAEVLERGLQAQADAAAATAGQVAPRVSIPVTDVVPLSPDDPRGSGFMVGMFPVVIGGILGGVGLSVAVAGGRRRALAVVGYAAASGLVLAAVLVSWFGTLQGPWWTQAGAIALTVAAIAAPIAGLATWLGIPGLPVGAALMLLVGNPLSGVMIPAQFLPAPWGTVGRWLPPGATASLLRDVSYFPSADATLPWLVLAGWALVGLAACALAHDRTAAAVTAPAAGDEPAPLLAPATAPSPS